MSDTVIKVENLSKVYKLYNKPIDRLKESLNPFKKKYHHDFYALKDINFEIKKGEAVGIIGKNGSGKSTLLKILTGVLTPSSGSYTVNGKVSALLELGTGFNQELTGIENIYFSGTIMGYTKDEMDRKVDDILSFADIGEFIKQPVKTYSSGMFVRLAFAVAINVDPEILIVDEALSVGDVRFQQKCFAKFESFKEREKTILFVTHATDLVKMYCGSAILLNDGKIEEIGQPKDVVNTYLRLMRDMDLNDVNKSSENKNIEERNQNCDLQDIEKSIWYNPNEYKYGTGETVFTKVKICDDDGKYKQDFEIGSYINLYVELLANEDSDTLYLGYGVRNIQGQDLIVFNGTPKYDNFPIDNVRKGNTYNFKIRFKASLIPNDYTIALAIAKVQENEIVNLQIRYDVLIFKIIPKKRLYAGVFYQDTEIIKL